ncbi:MAG: bifunctional 3,4-dihydroxy-2-butanone-4-phosphate synthase/GTP cyclohydrolase II [Candidatus Cloacimonetes bacterium]|jgi:3,4-dihydroxy 2-butanone 4-phosphate synthase / GTP cyclohydrolase II|nr:bifunctional 3,4-dihydroxy-2-butanone-4-phosphate synthase/GTP cyclohydrolase II [Candidatus Cloacimonadota bacterium]MBT6994260.1 bifunctional 3,4-dihydroxy-2-butanone-4-phosphate synthase/GTP cyclohydrolase II [Candidatus Cloacimonadota bacterium]MBT7469155.1 bifunctional 3,4-dihydroxy-2-butanone-4-phosphate synthase/GTP cyclohydrolase II [Candidatus Cloacimonadota bacterium]
MLNTIEEAILDIKNGKMIIVVDDENRENEGDFVMAAEKVTPEAVNFMISKGKGLVCTPMLKQHLEKLKIFKMTSGNTDPYHTAFTVSVDYKTTKTGISAGERATTIKALTNPLAMPTDFNRPGHIFPLIAKENGVLDRAGHTEASVDLAKLAGLFPAGVICEIVDENGEMARLDRLKILAKKWDLKIISIEDLIEYRQKNFAVVEKVSALNLPTDFGIFKMYAYQAEDALEPHLALIMGNLKSDEPVLTRIHSECFTGDVLGSLRCDCGIQLQTALQKISEKGEGIFIYLRQEGRGIGLKNKLKAYELQEKGLDTVEANIELGFDAELRNFAVAASILKDLNVFKVRLMTNNPLKIADLKKSGIETVIREPHEIAPNNINYSYLQTKKNKMGHLLKEKIGGKNV